MTFEPVKRKSLIVWLYSLKQLRVIRKFGHVHYISERLKYVVLYVNEEMEETVIQQLSRYHFVRKIEPSYRDDIDMTFKDSIPNRKDPDMRSETTETETGDRFLKQLVNSLEKDQ